MRWVSPLSAVLISFTLAVEHSFAAGFTPPATRPQTVEVAAIQCSSDLGNINANSAKLQNLIQQAAAHGAKIVVLPEASITGYLSQDLQTNWHIPGRPLAPEFVGRDPAPVTETVPGPSTDRFRALAKQLGIYLTIPLIEVEKHPPDKNSPDANAPNVNTQTGDLYFNTVCLASPDGNLVAHYRKLNPWPYPEVAWATPGDRGVQTYVTEYGRVGLAICYDIHTILKAYEPHKIWALLYPIAWVDRDHPADWFWYRLPQRIAPFNHYVIGANWSVDHPEPWFGYGFSTIYAPNGSILATSHALYGSDIIYATLKTAWAK